MKANFSICMTSRMRGPRAEISDERAKTISELVARITEPWTGLELLGMGLSPDHYMVYWDEDDAPIRAVSVFSNGWVSILKRGDTEWHVFTDTVGLWASLADIGSAAFQKWTLGILDAWSNF